MNNEDYIALQDLLRQTPIPPEAYIEISNLLLKIPKEQINSDFKVGESSGLSPLQFVCFHYNKFPGKMALVRGLIANGADVNYTGKNHATALIRACGTGDYDLCEFLINNGARINDVDDLGRTALFRACMKGDMLPTIEMLVENGADVNIPTNKGTTPLMMAAEIAEIEVVRLLITNSDVNAVDQKGRTALILVSDNNENEDEIHMIQFLLDNGAEVNAVGKDGDTAIMKAARKNNIKMAELLLKKGASIDPESEAWKKIFALNNDCVKYIKKIHANRGIVPMLQQATLKDKQASLKDKQASLKDKKNKETFLPPELIREVYGALTDVKKPKKPPTHQ